MGLSQNSLARAVNVPPRRINEIVLGKRSITADTDLRLARFQRMFEMIDWQFHFLLLIFATEVTEGTEQIQRSNRPL